MKYLLTGFLCLSCGWTAVAASLFPLVPLPQIVQSNGGSFTLCPPQTVAGAPVPAPTPILVGPGAQETGEYLAMQLFKSTGYRFLVLSNAGSVAVPGAVLLTTNSALATLGAEGYELTIAT